MRTNPTEAGSPTPPSALAVGPGRRNFRTPPTASRTAAAAYGPAIPPIRASYQGGMMDEMIDEETRSTLAAVDRFNGAFTRHDVDAGMAAMTDDCVFECTSPPDGDH